MKELFQLTRSTAFQKRVLSLVSVWMAALLLVFAMPITASAADSGEYVNATDPGKNWGNANMTQDSDELKAIMPLDSDVLQGENVEFMLVVIKKEDSSDWGTLSCGGLDAFNELFESPENDGEEIAAYLNIAIGWKLQQNSFDQYNELSELNKPITITFTLPEDLLNTDATKQREYYFYHVYSDGAGGLAVEKLPAAFDGVNKLSLDTDSFSPYVLTYIDKDAPQAPDIPFTENDFVPIIPMPGAPVNPAPDADVEADAPIVIVPDTDAPTVSLPATGSDNTASIMAALLLAGAALLVSRKKARA